VTDNTIPPVPPIPPVPGATTPAPEEQAPDSQQQAPVPPAGGEYVEPAPTAYSAPASNPYAPEQPQQPYGQDQSGYAQQQYAQQQYAQQPYGQQPVYGQQQPYGAYAAAPPKGLSIASLICGIGGFVTISFGIGFFAAIAAIILGFIAKKNQPYAKGMWLTGIITGFVTVGLSVIGLVGIILYYVFAFNTYSGYDTF